MTREVGTMSAKHEAKVSPPSLPKIAPWKIFLRPTAFRQTVKPRVWVAKIPKISILSLDAGVPSRKAHSIWRSHRCCGTRAVRADPSYR